MADYKESDPFYHSKEWKRLRKAALARDNGMCVDCMDSDEECLKCRLYQLLTAILPLDDYHNGMLCPYNMGEWAN
mgnify:CR=1 FL=1